MVVGLIDPLMRLVHGHVRGNIDYTASYLLLGNAHTQPRKSRCISVYTMSECGSPRLILL